jgi:hypothetical protein
LKFSLLYENTIWIFYIYFWETYPYAWKQKIFFLFFNVLTKTGWFNTGFVSLQYKNTNWYWLKWSIIFFGKITDLYKLVLIKMKYNFFQKNHRFFWNNFWRNFFVAGPDPTQKETGPKSAENEIRPTFYRVGLSLAIWAGLSSPKEQLTSYCAELIIFPLLQNVNCSRSACKGKQQGKGDRERERYLEWVIVLLSPVIAHGGAG